MALSAAQCRSLRYLEKKYGVIDKFFSTDAELVQLLFQRCDRTGFTALDLQFEKDLLWNRPGLASKYEVHLFEFFHRTLSRKDLGASFEAFLDICKILRSKGISFESRT